MFAKITDCIKSKKVKLVVSAFTVMSALSVVGVTSFAASGGTTTAPTINLTGVDFTPLVNAITSIVPEVMPVVVTVLGVRKAISFMMGCIRGC